jgi:signal peptide peptidase SppA
MLSQEDASVQFEGRRRQDEDLHVVGQDALIAVSGPLSYRLDFWAWLSGGSSYIGISNQIQLAINDPNVTRIVMVFDTPGGEIVGLQETAELISSSPKEVVAVVDPCCASAGLWLASQANRIVSMPSGETGSLGVQCIVANYAKYYENLGVDVKVFRAAISPDKNLGHPAEEMSEKAINYFQERVDLCGQKFVAAVAKGRGVDEAQVLEQFGQGKMLWADEAVKVKLIDEVGSLADVLSQNRASTKKSTRTARIERRPTY